jgi:translation initiation factor IF-3
VKIRKNEELLGLPSVDVISVSGERLGIMRPAEALRLAREQGADLLEVNPNAKPPACKIVDFTRYKYEELKKAAQARRVPRRWSSSCARSSSSRVVRARSSSGTS